MNAKRLCRFAIKVHFQSCFGGYFQQYVRQRFLLIFHFLSELDFVENVINYCLRLVDSEMFGNEKSANNISDPNF